MKRRLFGLVIAILCLNGCMEEQHTAPAGNSSPFGSPAVKVQALKPQALVVLESALKSPDAYLRANAVEVAVTTKQIQFLPQLTKLTTDSAPAVRFAATAAIGDLGFQSCETIVRKMLNDPDTKVRMAASYSLVKLGKAEFADRLRAGTKSTDPSVRANAVLLIGKLDNPEDIPLLYKVLQDDVSNDLVRMQAVESIARLGDEQIYRTKLWALLISKFNDDRVIGIRGMGALGTPLAIDAIRTMLNDDVREVRLAAAYELARRGNKSGMEQVQKYLKENPDIEMPDIANSMSLSAIGYLKNAQLNSYLPHAITRTDEHIRLLAAQSVLLQNQP